MRTRALFLIGCVTALLTAVAPQAHAITSVPQKIVYNGHLLDSSGNPITTAHSVRFSFWSSADYLSTDTTVAGAIETSAPNYQGWNEVHTVTPNADGFFTVNLGSVTPLPGMDSFSVAGLLSFYIQVEIKAQASPDTSYEQMDVSPSDATNDRSPVSSVPFSLNSDFLDQREIGTGSGNIALLTTGGVYGPSVIPGGTNIDRFAIDFDDTATGVIELAFGQTLNKVLSYDVAGGFFSFNDDVRVTGSLTVSGLINGVDISSLSGASDTKLRVFSGAGLTVNIMEGGYRLAGVTTYYAGAAGVALTDNATNSLYLDGTGLVVSTTGFPTNKSLIPLASVVTSGGNVFTVSDRRVFQSDDREHLKTVVFQPEYDGAAFHDDGSGNVGQLRIDYDAVSRKNTYVWNSTRSTLNDYQIMVPYRIPEGFVQFGTPALTLLYKTGTALAADNAIDVVVTDTAGASVTLVGSSTNLVNTSWTQTTLNFGGSPTFTVGQDMLVTIVLTSKVGGSAQVGTLELKHKALQP